MEISTKQYKRVVVVAINGRIDSAAASEFETALNQLTEDGQDTIVLDLNEVEFLASAALRVMVTIRKAVQEKGGELAIAQPSPRVIDTLEIAGLNVLFTTYPDRETAIGSF